MYLVNSDKMRKEKNEKLALSDEILMQVDKAARYIGGEVNSVMKDKNKLTSVLPCAFRMSMRSACPIWA